MASTEEYTLQTGVKHINSLKEQKVTQLCEHILCVMIECKLGNQIFTETELNQLCKIFGLTRPALLLVTDCMTYIYYQCALLRGAKKIIKFLQDLALDPPYVEAVASAWKTHGAKYMSILKDKTINLTTDNKLEGFNWKLSLPIARSGVESTKWGELMPNERAAVAEMQFTVNKEKASIELTKTQLQGLYEEFEKIQIKIDELTK